MKVSSRIWVWFVCYILCLREFVFATLCEGLSGSSSPRCSINCFSDGEAHIKVLLGSVQAYFTKSRQWQVLTVLYIGNEQTPADDHSEYSVLALNLRDIGTGLSYGTIAPLESGNENTSKLCLLMKINLKASQGVKTFAKTFN